MKKRNNKEEVEKLLNDDNFLIWCIAPGVVRHGWWLEWLKHSSERAAVVDEAKAIVLSLRINEYTLTDDEIAVMQNNLNKRLKRKRALLRYWSAAAVVLFLFAGASLWFFNDKPFTECRLMEQATINSLSIDEAQTEIELFVRNKEKYLLPNEALIKLQSTGAIKLEEAKIGKIEEKDHIASLKAEKEIPYNTLKVPYGRRSSLTFSDGTKAWVNAGTVLVFPSVFEKKERRIEVSGEIFLEVAKDASRPFFVKTSQIEVKVLGTSFNVTAYPEDQNQSVILVDGQVEIDFGENRSLRLEPDHRAVLSTADAVVTRVNTKNYISWKDGVLQFENERLSHVLNCLSRYYRLNFEFDPGIGEFVCSGKLVLFNDVVKVMNTLEKSFPITCELKGSVIKLIKKQ